MSSQQQIIERIRKLEALALSEKKIGNLQVAKTAQNKADDLKQKYNLSNFNFNTSNFNKEQNFVKDERLYRFRKTLRFPSKHKQVIIDLLVTLSISHNCDIETASIKVVEKRFFFFPYKSIVDFSFTGSYKDLSNLRSDFYDLLGRGL